MTFVFSERVRALLASPHYMALPLAGVDISASAVKAVRLAESAHGLILASCVETKLPVGACVDGEILDHTAVTTALTMAAEATGITAAHVALPESKSYLFETAASGKNKAEWYTSIEQHLDECVPLPPAETVFDFVVVGRTERAEALVAGIGFAHRIIDDTLAVFDKAELTVRSLEGETFAAARAVLAPHDESTVLIIDIGKTTTKISIVVHRIPRFATTITIGGQALTLAIQKYFGVTEEEAQNLKKEKGIVPLAGNEDYLAAVLSTLSVIRDEISRHLTYWKKRSEHEEGQKPVSRVIVVGGNASVRGLSEYLEGALQIPVMTGDVFTNFASRETWIPSVEYAESLSYATAIGLALRDRITAYAY
jgi:type IV pilus assembly protein PilM